MSIEDQSRALIEGIDQHLTKNAYSTHDPVYLKCMKIPGREVTN